jgi:hypothetical protein
LQVRSAMANKPTLDELNAGLEKIKQSVVEHEINGRRIRDLEEDLQLQHERIAELALILESEEEDVDQLEGLSLRGMFLSVFGGKDETLDSERREYFAAWLKHDQATEVADRTGTELATLRHQGSGLGKLRIQRVALLREKEQFMIGAGDHFSELLRDLAEERGELNARQKELEEALREGYHLREGLDGVIRELRQARDWGAFDLLGGGIITTAIKHSNIDDARSKIAGVQVQLNRFRREMADVEMETNIEIEIGKFATFADYFFDGLIFDWVVQSQISKSLSQVEQTRRAVSSCLTQLRLKLEKTQAREIAIARERCVIVEKA